MAVGVAGLAAAACGDDATPAGTCSSALTGDAPFGKVLSGTGQFTTLGPNPAGQVRPRTVTVHAYFPGGRRAGASVILAMPTKYPRPGLAWSLPSLLEPAATTCRSRR